MSHPIEVTDAEFATSVLESEVPVVVDFWAPWCAPCRMLAPFLEELADEFDGRLRIAKVNIDEHGLYASRLRIQGFPTLVVFHAGREIDRIYGLQPKSALRGRFESALASLPGAATAEGPVALPVNGPVNGPVTGEPVAAETVGPAPAPTEPSLA